MPDIAGGEFFSDGQNVTGARLNNHVNGATINASFISNKSLAVAVAADSFLFYQASGAALQRATLSSLQSALFVAPTLSGTVSLSQALVISGEITPTQIAADTNDYNPTGLSTATTLRLSTDAARNITGIAGGIADRILILLNVGSFNFTLNNENASSTAANRFNLADSLDDTIFPGGGRILQYDSTSARWRMLSRITNLNPTFTTLTDGATVTLTCDGNKVSQNSLVTLAGSRQLVFSGLVAGMTGVLKVIQDGTGSRKLALPGPSFTDGVGNNTTTFTSATAVFVAGDVGRVISQSGNTNIPAGTTIASRTNATTVVLSATCTTANPITFYLPGRQSLSASGGAGAVVLSTAASSVDVLTWAYDGTYILWQKSLNFT